MEKELAKTLTTALVQFIDREQPKNKMCVSSVEAEELERCFTEEKFDKVEDWYAYRMKPELTEFENAFVRFLSMSQGEPPRGIEDFAKEHSKELLALAKKELCSFCDEHLKGFPEGYDKANKDKSYHFPPNHIWSPLCWEPGGTCTNPHFDCINCPKKTTGGIFTSPNTATGTSTGTLHGNTSATDGKEHNPSFLD